MLIHNQSDDGASEPLAYLPRPVPQASSVVENTHDATHWRNSLYHFARLLFKEGLAPPTTCLLMREPTPGGSPTLAHLCAVGSVASRSEVTGPLGAAHAEAFQFLRVSGWSRSRGASRRNYRFGLGHPGSDSFENAGGL